MSYAVKEVVGYQVLEDAHDGVHMMHTMCNTLRSMLRSIL